MKVGKYSRAFIPSSTEICEVCNGLSAVLKNSDLSLVGYFCNGLGKQPFGYHWFPTTRTHFSD